MEETLEGGRGPLRAVAPLERERERERDKALNIKLHFPGHPEHLMYPTNILFVLTVVKILCKQALISRFQGYTELTENTIHMLSSN
jgi:hypothetical protein